MADEGLRVVGLAVKKEKWHKHISQTLLDKAREAGFILKQLDQDVPLEEQGRLDALLQKLRKPEWEEQLERYAEAHPEVKVFDRPAATLPIRNRGTMLTMLEGEGWLFQEPGSEPAAQPQYRVSVPTNTTLQEGISLTAAQQQVAEAGLQYPMLAKPVWADGREGSHALAVIATEAGLQQLVEGRAGGDFGLPVLLQQYVPHGGCLFKVYVLGSTVVTVKRGSLELELISTGGRSPRAPQQALAAARPPSKSSADAGPAPAAVARCQPNGHAQPASHGAAAPALPDAAASRDPGATQSPSPLPSADSEVLPDLELIERVSAYPRSRSWGKWDLAPKGSCVQGPPAWLMQHLAQRLRQHLGLNLFNFDVIVPLATQERWGQQPERHSSDNGWLNGCRRSRSGTGSCDECGTCAGDSRPQLVYVIDINYFPGYEKLPGYEELMVQFLTSIWAEEAKGVGRCTKGPASEHDQDLV